MGSISDLVSKLKSALKSGQPYAIVKNTRIVVNILNLLYREGFIVGYMGADVNLKIQLGYPDGNCIIKDIRLISCPSRIVSLRKTRCHMQYNYAKTLQVLAILSTSNGIINQHDVVIKANSVTGILLFELT